ncbi:hypothetical protein GLOIN_2v1837680 [Rhizophagus clarus]|uniref:HECT domain-containing protein n=1 Tax=Rhizophagus clarus TaxID=94130 RepID=A0A8H3QJQ0_9GLOM|nr:hypothetical protein GLOIN_2v1837680 [Rhizophagus clarus]
MDSMEDLPLKCYACNACQKFVPTPTHTSICANCFHSKSFHDLYEEFLELKFMAFKTRTNFQNSNQESVSSLSNNLTSHHENTPASNNTLAEIDTFLSESSIRNRLRSLPSIQNLNSSRDISIQNLTNLYNDVSLNIKTNTGFKQTINTIILVPYIENNKTLAKDSFEWNYLKNIGLIKENVIFYDGTTEGIENKMISEFPVIRECGWQFLRPMSAHSSDLIPFKINEIKNGQTMRSAYTNRRRLYIGPTIKNIIDPPHQMINANRRLQYPASAVSTNSTLANPIISTTLAMSSASISSTNSTALSTLTPTIPISSITSTTTIASGFSDNNIQSSNRNTANYDNLQDADKFRIDLLRLLRNKYNIEQHKTKTLNFDKLDLSFDFLLSWAKDAHIEDFLKNPVIILNDDVVDTGGVFRSITESFWQTIKPKSVIGGKLFDGYHLHLIQQNSDLVNWSYPTIIGKILFWSWIHQGSWPKWLDPLHLKYIIYGKESIVCTNALFEHIPFLYNLSKDFMENPNAKKDEILLYNNINLANFIAEFEIITKRQKSLEMLKDGFNFADCLSEFKGINWEMLESELYTKLNPTLFLQQIDNLHVEMTIKEIPSERNNRQQIYDWFNEWIFDQNTENLEKLLIFISGTSRIPLSQKITIGWRKYSEQSNINPIYGKLPYASTCACSLVLCQDYDSKEQFNMCLEICLNSTEFSESGYRKIIQSIENDDDLNQSVETIDLTNNDDIEDVEEQDVINDIVTIDIHSEVYTRSRNRRKRSIRQTASNKNIHEQNINHHFVEVTAEDILGGQKRSSPKRTVTTRSQSLNRNNNPDSLGNGNESEGGSGNGNERQSRGRGKVRGRGRGRGSGSSKGKRTRRRGSDNN